MEFDMPKTAAAFVAVVVIGAVATLPMMPTRVVFMMVLPSMAVFGLITLAIGVKHGEYRERRSS